ncbi:MAG: hypothetical protein A3A86_00950 [Elusimicrobia bacterium RIFCSPLOWO2_01_FULL_60_11]|nr:MAG: hypothetical protein A3A86_00950 [Elusimicrobia bacterium RIFCSPLOWO2_01_FULL_60_11]
MSRFEIKGKVIAITGATSGIGLAAAKLFARKGAKVALIGRGADRVEKAVEEARAASNGTVEGFVLELKDAPQIGSTVDKIRGKFGDVDVLINNAAYAVAGLAEDCPVEKYKENFEVNFFAPLTFIQAVIPGMKKKKSGQIINISSGVGKRALPGFSSYCATKFALNGLTESLRLELAPWDIDVISISPGTVSTPFHKNVQFYGRWKVDIAAMNMRTPEKIAEFILSASRSRRREATVFGPGLIGYHINYWAPWLVDRLLAKKYPVS